MTRVLITGSSGLVGCALRRTLAARGHRVHGFDLRAAPAERGDVCDRRGVAAALRGVGGVIHLAAVSRVVWAERDLRGCWKVNVDGLDNVLALAMAQANPPWIIFASSREVHGEPSSLPVREDDPSRPVNAYGRSKVAGERLVADACARGLRAAVVRLSNVYGTTSDHADRVIPAFARAAASGSILRVEGPAHTFDFTHVDDVARGIADVADRLDVGMMLPPIQFVTGNPTTLEELARLAIELGDTGAAAEVATPRALDVARFYGCPARANAILSWSPRVVLREGLARLIDDFRNELDVERRGMAAT